MPRPAPPPRCRRARCRACWRPRRRRRRSGSMPSPPARLRPLLAVGPKPSGDRAEGDSMSGQRAVARRRRGGSGRGRTAAPGGRRTRGRASSRATPAGRPPRRPRSSARRPAGGPGAGHLLQRLRDRADRAEVGAGADDHLGAGLAQAAHGVAEVAHRRRRPHRVGDVVGADQDHGDVGARSGARGRPGRRGRGTAPRRRDPQVDPPVGALAATPGGERRPGSRSTWSHAVARRRWSRRAARS